MNALKSFAVVDVETTGFSPNYHHRVIEIGIVRLARNGEVEEEYETLVNPNRDVGPVHIHGIRARELKQAPSFEEVAGDVLAMLTGAVFVAHNVRFDWAFIEAELSRVGIQLSDVPQLCTMELAEALDPSLPCRKLSAVCQHLGIPLDHHHRAIADARAAAALLQRCLEKDQGNQLALMAKRLAREMLPTTRWPSMPRTGKRLPRSMESVAEPSSPSFLGRLIDKLPSYKDCTPQTKSYLASLDDALADRVLSAEEAADLQALAQSLGLLREQVILVHTRYLDDLIEAAFADAKLTSTELEDLEQVADLLNISRSELETLLSKQGFRLRKAVPCRSPGAVVIGDLRGKSICFTGIFICEVDGHTPGRQAAERLAAERGMKVKSSVVKSLDLLVAADVDTMSTKARKAQAYGIRMISEREFWNLFGFTANP